MKDEVLNSFIKKLLSEEIDTERFKQYVEMFSKFLGYTNSDYKYNGTYLSQYIDDFMELRQMIKKKNEKYKEILLELMATKEEFELLIDKIFLVAISSQPEVKWEYIGIHKRKIVSKTIEIRIKIELEDEYIFCKEYDDFEKENLPKLICSDVINFVEKKREQEADNETS